MKPLIKKKSGGQYSWQDYLNWPENERWEIIDGVAYNMSPAPSIKHQTTAGNLFSLLNQKLVGKPCKPFIAPTDVVLSEHDIVQPDVLIVCDQSRITEQTIQGAPDLVVEVLSPATALKDLREKKALYERFAVKEYIILDPLELYVQQFFLGKDGAYGKGEVLGPQEILQLKTIEGIEIMLWEVFEVERPLEEELSP